MPKLPPLLLLLAAAVLLLKFWPAIRAKVSSYLP